MRGISGSRRRCGSPLDGYVAAVVSGKLDAAAVAGVTGDIPQKVKFAVTPFRVSCAGGRAASSRGKAV